MPLNFPYDYGDDLTIEQAKQNLKDHSKDIIAILPFLILTIGATAYATDGPPANDPGTKPDPSISKAPTSKPGPNPSTKNSGTVTPKEQQPIFQQHLHQVMYVMAKKVF